MLKKIKSIEKQQLDEISLSGLKWRNVDLALTSGCISDIVVNLDNFYEYYVAVSPESVWKTDNEGLTHTPLFGSQGAYPIGCVTMDSNNSNVIWINRQE